MFCGHLENFQAKKNFEFHLELNFNKFQERKNGKFCYDILTVGVDIIGFDVNIISELVFTLIIYLFLLFF